MKRELLLHYLFWFAFFLFVAIFKNYLALNAWLFWIGGIVGTLLPDIDHVVYVLFLNPNELTSMRFSSLIAQKETWRAVELLYETRGERRGLIFHTIFFQIIFLVLTFWMLSSSGSLFGKGLVLAFALHLSIDQIVDLTELGSFANWLKFSPIEFDFSKAKIYWLVTTVLLVLFGFFL